jgi:hypothetical protein
LNDEGYGNISRSYGHVYIATFLEGDCKIDSLVEIMLIKKVIILVTVDVGQITVGKKDKSQSL